MSVKFVWDDNKAEANIFKHAVSFQEARIISARLATKIERKNYESNEF